MRIHTALGGLFMVASSLALIWHQDPGPTGLQPVQPPPSGQLQPVQPFALSPQAPPTLDWRSALKDANLDARMATVWQALDAVGHDAELRAALQDWAVADDDRELAWTAHLILDLADRGVRSRAQSTSPFGSLPWGNAFPQLPFFQTPSFGGNPFDALWPDPLQPGTGGGTFERKQTSFEMTPDGVKMHIETTGPDGTQTETFEAETMDELKAAHPELFEGGGLVPRMSGGSLFGFGPHSTGPALGGPVHGLRTDVLGVMVATDAEGDGLLVQRVFADTIAGALGLNAGDRIVRINARPITRIEDIKAELEARAADGALEVEWIGSRGTHHTATWKP